MTPSWVRITDPSGKQSNFLILPFSNSKMSAQGASIRLPVGGMVPNGVSSRPDDDGFAHGPKVVELPVHVGKGRCVISDGIIPLVGSPVGDTDRLVREDAVIGEESFPTFEIHSLRDRIRVSNKA